MAPTPRRPAKRSRPQPPAPKQARTTRQSTKKEATKKPPARAPRSPSARASGKRDEGRPARQAPPVLLPAEAPLEAEPVEEAAPRLGRILPIEVDPRQVEAALAKVGAELKHWANKGRYTRVRFKFRGKQLLPDLPLAAVVAAEGLTFYWGGILRMLLVNVAGGSLLNVELVNDSERKVQAGKEALLSGDLEAALGHFRAALEMDRDSALASLNLGVALKLKGDREAARDALQKARKLDPQGGVGSEAERLLTTLTPPG
jgi:tetratricopeptide (TPR) repeat protein